MTSEGAPPPARVYWLGAAGACLLMTSSLLLTLSDNAPVPPVVLVGFGLASGALAVGLAVVAMRRP